MRQKKLSQKKTDRGECNREDNMIIKEQLE